MPTPPTVFEIDASDRIVAVDRAWLEYAAANDAPDLTRDRVLETSLWDYIEGSELKLLYHGILERVRESNTPLEIPFRCDSPTHARFMRLRIAPRGIGHSLQLESKTLRITQRASIGLLERDRADPNMRPLSICSVCKAIRMPDSNWAELEEAIVKLELTGAYDPPRLSHGICDHCSDQLR